MNIINIADTVMNRAARYHEHRVEGLKHIPASGPALIVVNHSLATYDSGLLAAAIKAKLGRDVWLLGDRYIFKVPVLRDMATAYGFVEGSQHNAESLLRDGELVLVAPGGMREALRPSSQKYQLNIGDRNKLVHYLNAPMSPPDNCSDDDPNAVDAFHATLERRLQEMLTEYAST